MTKLPNILWHEPTGTVYWTDGDTIMGAPMLTNSTCKLSEAFSIDQWDSEEMGRDIKLQLLMLDNK